MSGSIERLDRRHVYKGPVQAVVLDWSGTTADQHTLAPAVVFCETFKEFGVEITMAEAREPMGLRKDLHIAAILEMPDVRERWIAVKGREPAQSDVDEMYAFFKPRQCEVLGQYTDVIPGTVEAMNTLRSEMNIKVGCTTGFSRDMVNILLEGVEKQGYVPDAAVAGDDVSYGMGTRPAPFMLYENLLQMGVWPCQSVVKVDDCNSGIGEGLSAGCWTVGVAAYSNYTNADSLEQWEAMSDAERADRIAKSREKLRKSGAHYVADSIAELPEICRDINRRLALGEHPMLMN